MRARLRLTPALLLGPLAAIALLSPPREAKACGGGMFPAPDETETTLVTGHRVAISISTTQTVLWDQVHYTGKPKDFAWVMPVHAGAKMEIGSAAFIDTLDAHTATVVSSPEVYCDSGGGSESSGGCCGTALRGGGDGSLGGDGNREQDPGVTVVNSATVGPYDTVTIASGMPGAISKWLTDNGYNIPADFAPLLDDYTAEGFQFLAARLKPDAGVEQIKPIRVVMPGMESTFPMRMLGANADDKVGLQLFVITEGRMKVDGFGEAKVDASRVTWDFVKHTSDYAAQRDKALSAGDGANFLTAYAANEGLFIPPAAGAIILSDKSAKDSLVAAYFEQGRLYGDTSDVCGASTVIEAGMADGKVVDVCPDDGSPCGTPGAGEIDSRAFGCSELDDLSVAMTGLHPASTWLTRFEANLPVAALKQDLTLSPISTQVAVSNLIVAGESNGDPCGTAAAAFLEAGKAPRPPSAPGRLALITAFAGLLAAIARRTMARTRRSLLLGTGRAPV
ncbi:MAG: DUF2330 domain-containing protein [Byssovorax sp.]